MDDENLTKRRNRLIIAFAGLTVLATIMLDAPWLQFQPLALWAQLVAPALLVAGLIGSARNIPPLRIAGWIGVFTVILFGLNFVIAGEDYVFGGPGGPPLSAPRSPSVTEVRLRLASWLILSVLLVWCFRKLGELR